MKKRWATLVFLLVVVLILTGCYTVNISDSTTTDPVMGDVPAALYTVANDGTETLFSNITVTDGAYSNSSGGLPISPDSYVLRVPAGTYNGIEYEAYAHFFTISAEEIAASTSTNPYTINVSLVQATYPTAVLTAPADLSTDVSLATTEITLTFSEAVVASTGSIIISDGVSDLTAPASTATVNGVVVTIPISAFTPTLTLTYSKTYSVSLTDDAFQDTLGYANAAAITGSFSTVVWVDPPTASPAGGAYAAAQAVTLNCGTQGAQIYYTLDGSEPTTASTLYTAPITVQPGETLKAFAAVSAASYSGVTTETYTLFVAPKTEPSPTRTASGLPSTGDNTLLVSFGFLAVVSLAVLSLILKRKSTK